MTIPACSTCKSLAFCTKNGIDFGSDACKARINFKTSGKRPAAKPELKPEAKPNKINSFEDNLREIGNGIGQFVKSVGDFFG